MKIYFLFILIFALASCSSLNQEAPEKKNVAEVYVASGVVSYFLPELPAWANFSESGACFRKSSLRYFNLQGLKNSFSLSYEQLVQFQYMFNNDFANLKKDHKLTSLSFKEEENLFYQILGKTQAEVKAFLRPKFEKIHLVWIDPVLNSPQKLESLKRLMMSDEMFTGQPVFVSLCLGHEEMNAFLKVTNLDANILVIPAEMFSTFDRSGIPTPKFLLDFSEVFDKLQKLHFYLFQEKVPPEFVGDFSIHKITD